MARIPAWAEDFWANAIWREEGGVRGLKQNIEGETDIRVYRDVENHDPHQHSIKTRRVGCGQKLQVTITARRYNIVPSRQIILIL